MSRSSRVQLGAPPGPIIAVLMGAFLLGLAPAVSGRAAAATTLDCEGKPVNMTIGGAVWQLRGCNDKHSVVLLAPKGSPAAPFYFMFYWKGGLYTLLGEGTGDKQATAKAYNELSLYSRAEIEALVAKAATP